MFSKYIESQSRLLIPADAPCVFDRKLFCFVVNIHFIYSFNIIFYSLEEKLDNI